MGDGDEAIKPLPVFFLCFECSRSWCVPSLGCLLLIRSLCSSDIMSFSPRLACRPSGRAAGRGLSCRCAVRCCLPLVARFPCRAAWRRSAFLVSWLSACGGSLVLRGSSRLIGTGGGTVRLPPSACLEEAGVECVDYVECLFSVDYFEAGGYINTRALIGFSFRCFLARACCAGGFSVLLPPPNRSRSMPPLIGSSGARTGAIFLPIFISSHPISRLLAYGFAFCYPATLISISPRSSPRYPRHEGRGGHGCDTADGGGGLSCLPRAGGDGWRRGG